MLLLEFIINNPFIDTDDLRHAIFKCVENGYDGIVLPSGLINTARSIYSDFNYTVICGYPYGIQSPEVKAHEIVENSKHGIKIIDYVLNEYYIRNLDLGRIIKELTVANKICRDSNILLRAVFEHRLCSIPRCIQVASAVKDSSVDTLILSTGNMPENLSDSLIACYKLKERIDIDIGIYKHKWDTKQLDSLERVGCSLARTSSIKNI